MASKRSAVIVGGGYSKIGVRQASWLNMIQEAAGTTAEDIPGLKPSDVEGVIIGG
ncbi:MAG TPA: hypothetical protein VLH15_11950 [Dehalococcoidales bacterium]|nr:hypothetical protein [Dehalococcoidales bacterium]